jgi:type I restriction enzyme M protein
LKEKKARRFKKPFKGLFEPHLRWASFKNLSGDEMLAVVRDQVFVELKSKVGGVYMADAQLMIQKPSLLVSAVTMVDQLPLTEGIRRGICMSICCRS